MIHAITMVGLGAVGALASALGAFVGVGGGVETLPPTMHEALLMRGQILARPDSGQKRRRRSLGGGLDVHQKTVVACARVVDDGKVSKEVRTFDTTTAGLLELSEWLESMSYGAPWLKTTLVLCAWAAVRTKDTYLGAKFHRLKSRVGPMKAIIAVAASFEPKGDQP
jgi:hypothetical protein